MPDRSLDETTLPSSYDLSRIDMTGTEYEEFEGHQLGEVVNYNNLRKEVIAQFDFKEFLNSYNKSIEFFTEKDFKNCESVAEKILRIITSPKYRNGSLDTINLEKFKTFFLEKINFWVEKNEQIQFMLPAFPFKVANPLKSSRRDADLAEVGAFCKFNEINLQIKEIYSPGIRFIIFHDGHLYYRHFLHTKEDADRYFSSLNKFVDALGLKEVVELRDAYKELEQMDNFEEISQTARQEITKLWENSASNEKISQILESAKQNINLSDVPLNLLRKIAEFEEWDLSNTEKEIKRKIQEKAKNCAFEYMVVQHALEKANFFDSRVPNGIRLTVHPKEGQIGIYLVRKKTYLLPWMGVGVLKNNGEVSVHYESDLIMSGKYHPVFIEGEQYPFYYKEAEIIYEGLEQFKGLFDSVVRDLKKDDYYRVFAFGPEYHNVEVREILSNVHKALEDRQISDQAICKKENLDSLLETYKDNSNIEIRPTEDEVPVGVIILRDRVINLLWGTEPAAFEITDPEIVARYNDYFKEVWDKTTRYAAGRSV
ncbi:MAG: L-tyrosine/L-tryptophan isonitrile synthase family protein [Candidatus Paceibacterota bacterium]|jgi:pyoverdine/dityrosine biosynthesis protein Dit1